MKTVFTHLIKLLTYKNITFFLFLEAKCCTFVINIILQQMSQEQQIAIEERFAKVYNDQAFKERLSSADFEKYSSSLKRMSFSKYDIIFNDGESPKGVFYIEKGAAKLSKLGAFGKDQILRFIKEGDIIGYRSLLCGENFQAKAEAMTNTECVFLPADVFMYLLEEICIL